MTIRLYKMYDTNVKIDKILNTSTMQTLTGNQVDNNEPVTDPSFIINSATEPEYNYAYVVEWARYYFITSKTWVGGTAWQIDLHVDVLKTYADSIFVNSAMVAYSSAGSQTEQEPRMNYKGVPTITRTIGTQYPAFILDNSSTNLYTNEPWVMFRFYEVPQTVTIVPHPATYAATSINVGFMPWTEFEEFFARYHVRLNDAERKAFGAEIIDITTVYYINKTRLSESCYAKTEFTIHTLGYPNGLTVDGIGTTAEPKFYQIISPLTQEPLMGYSVIPGPVISNSNYWILHGTYRTKIPYIGEVTFSPAAVGITGATSIYYAVAVDAFSNQYVITPMTAADGSGIWFYDAMQHIPITTAAPFPIDTVIDNVDSKITAQTLGVIMGIVSAAAAPSPLSVGGAISGTITGGFGIRDTINAAKTHVQYIGQANGCSEWLPVDSTRIIQTSEIIEPDTNAVNFAAVYGKPDHNIRTLSSLRGTGYMQVERIRLNNIYRATDTEMNEIEKLLLSGVVA